MKSNRELCAEFRELLTTGFRIDGEIACSDLMNDAQQLEEALRLTKPWRNDLWKAFRELEDRLCPVDADMREKRKKLNAEQADQ